jgi:hypothetical protein
MDVSKTKYACARRAGADKKAHTHGQHHQKDQGELVLTHSLFGSLLSAALPVNGIDHSGEEQTNMTKPRSGFETELCGDACIAFSTSEKSSHIFGILQVFLKVILFPIWQ